MGMNLSTEPKTRTEHYIMQKCIYISSKEETYKYLGIKTIKKNREVITINIRILTT